LNFHAKQLELKLRKDMKNKPEKLQSSKERKYQIYEEEEDDLDGFIVGDDEEDQGRYLSILSFLLVVLHLFAFEFNP
jgi:hypothetical protein